MLLNRRIVLSPMSIIIICTLLCGVLGDVPLVKTTQGWVQGVRDEGYDTFLGIPYGVVDPDNVFGAAKPTLKQEGVYVAVDDSRVCPQVNKDNLTVFGTLDCLNLNVYVPRTSHKKAVLVWIYGGSFQRGSALKKYYGPRYLVRHDIILVTFNYRLGPYGFFCLDTKEIPGNQGMKDQVLALRWIRDNIEAFGGDKERITAAGCSFGAGSIELHLFSNQERLFNQAIIESGSPYMNGALGAANRSYPFILARHFGYDATDLTKALDFLAKLDPLELAKASSELFDKYPVCIEKEFDGVESFISHRDFNATKVNSMNIVIGYTKQEMLMDYIDIEPEVYFTQIDIFKETLKYFNVDDLQNIPGIMRRFYIGYEDISVNVRENLIDFFSDVSLVHFIWRDINKLIDYGANIYHYIFSYVGKRNYMTGRNNITCTGATHADEIGYIFDMDVFATDIDRRDSIMRDRMTAMWTNFVKYG
ncbi:juvenile hormone esterase-like [Leptidea sinapis]|uniref:juvenile hormone esterase-like n=1 Tax=Leptidea sinapis TaxID=189913 RepID=UPI0021C44D51|nr:juvenile hormone esterase-like [Leptidea sinapis]